MGAASAKAADAESDECDPQLVAADHPFWPSLVLGVICGYSDSSRHTECVQLSKHERLHVRT